MAPVLGASSSQSSTSSSSTAQQRSSSVYNNFQFNYQLGRRAIGAPRGSFLMHIEIDMPFYSLYIWRDVPKDKQVALGMAAEGAS